MIYGPLSELLGRRYCRRAGWSAAGLLWGPLSCEVVAGFQSREATPHRAPQLPVCLGHCEGHTSSLATTVAEPRVGRQPHHRGCLRPPADQAQADVQFAPWDPSRSSRPDPGLPLPVVTSDTHAPRGRDGCPYWALEETTQGQMGCCPEPHAGRGCTDTFSVRAGNHLPKPSRDGSMGLCWEGQHCPNWGPQLQGSQWGAPG